jgi:hypothetical protein
MTRALPCALLAVVLATGGNLAAQERIVPIEQEPKHVLKFQNAHVRFFDVQLPPGYEAQWHTHLHDGVFVNIAAGVTSAQDLGGQAESRPGRQPGDTYFLNYARKPKVHRVNNIGDVTYRVTDTEIHRGCDTYTPTPGAGGQSLVVENERVKVTRILLAPGERITLHPGCAMLVGVTAAGLAFESAGPTERIDMVEAGFKWRESMMPITLLNAGSSSFHGVDIVIK